MQSFRGFSAPALTSYAVEESRILKADHWRVMEGFRYYLGDKFSESWVFVPRGYLTDGASVPRLFWNLIPPWGAYGQAAIVHDYLCEFLTITVTGEVKKITRKQCDRIFLEAMEVLGVPKWKRELMYMAVSTYRVLASVSEPTFNPQIRQLEAAWEANHGCDGPVGRSY